MSKRTKTQPTLITPSATPPLSRRSPSKRQRLTSNPSRLSNHEIPVQTVEDIQQARHESSLRVQNIWSQLAERYSRPLDSDDIIDLNTLEFVKDRGVLRGAKETFSIGYFSEVDGEKNTVAPDSEDEVGPRALAKGIRDKEKEVKKVVVDPADEEDLRAFMEMERARRAGEQESDADLAESLDLDLEEAEELKKSKMEWLQKALDDATNSTEEDSAEDFLEEEEEEGEGDDPNSEKTAEVVDSEGENLLDTLEEEQKRFFEQPPQQPPTTDDAAGEDESEDELGGWDFDEGVRAIYQVPTKSSTTKPSAVHAKPAKPSISSYKLPLLLTPTPKSRFLTNTQDDDSDIEIIDAPPSPTKNKGKPRAAVPKLPSLRKETSEETSEEDLPALPSSRTRSSPKSKSTPRLTSNPTTIPILKPRTGLNPPPLQLQTPPLSQTSSATFTPIREGNPPENPSRDEIVPETPSPPPKTKSSLPLGRHFDTRVKPLHIAVPSTAKASAQTYTKAKTVLPSLPSSLKTPISSVTSKPRPKATETPVPKAKTSPKPKKPSPTVNKKSSSSSLTVALAAVTVSTPETKADRQKPVQTKPQGTPKSSPAVVSSDSTFKTPKPPKATTRKSSAPATPPTAADGLKPQEHKIARDTISKSPAPPRPPVVRGKSKSRRVVDSSEGEGTTEPEAPPLPKPKDTRHESEESDDPMGLVSNSPELIRAVSMPAATPAPLFPPPEKTKRPSVPSSSSKKRKRALPSSSDSEHDVGSGRGGEKTGRGKEVQRSQSWLEGWNEEGEELAATGSSPMPMRSRSRSHTKEVLSTEGDTGRSDTGIERSERSSSLFQNQAGPSRHQPHSYSPYPYLPQPGLAQSFQTPNRPCHSSRAASIHPYPGLGHSHSQPPPTFAPIQDPRAQFIISQAMHQLSCLVGGMPGPSSEGPMMGMGGGFMPYPPPHYQWPTYMPSRPPTHASDSSGSSSSHSSSRNAIASSSTFTTPTHVHKHPYPYSFAPAYSGGTLPPSSPLLDSSPSRPPPRIDTSQVRPKSLVRRSRSRGRKVSFNLEEEQVPHYAPQADEDGMQTSPPAGLGRHSKKYKGKDAESSGGKDEGRSASARRSDTESEGDDDRPVRARSSKGKARAHTPGPPSRNL